MDKIPGWIYPIICGLIALFMALYVDARADDLDKPIKRQQQINTTKIAVLENQVKTISENTKSTKEMLETLLLRMQIPLPDPKRSTR